jgi:Linalool dehydratase/isomerase
MVDAGGRGDRVSALELSRQARGWLRFLHQKATTPDDWSSSGRPAAWWDDRSTPPVLNFARFDLSESSYAIAMMADVTPAWREVYAEILDGLLDRHTTYWAAIDWLTQIGHDPDRENYPEDLARLWLPPHLIGRYDMPGWTANGVEPWGLAPDPIGAEGYLFFKGWFNLMLGFRGYVSRDGRWREPFAVTGYQDQLFSWTHDGINALLTRQWTARPEGLHCENTKVWPYCLSAAGLGLLMHDILTGRNDHWVFDQWVEIAKQKFMGLAADKVDWMALYYDPLEDYIHKAGATSGLSVSIYMLPQDRDLAEVLYRTAVDRIGWSDPTREVRTLPDPRFLLLGLVLAREFDDEVTLARLSEYSVNHFEPTFFGEGLDNFGWYFGLPEPFPRGQLNGLIMMADIGAPGAWGRVFSTPNLAKFEQPTVSGVDFPRLGIAAAWNDTTAGILHVRTYAATSSDRGVPTSFRVSLLPDAAAAVMRCDGADYQRWRVTGADAVEIDIDIDDHDLQIFWMTAPGRPGPDTEWRTNVPKAVSARPVPSGGARLGAAGGPAHLGPASYGAAGGNRLLGDAVPGPPCACC